MVENEERSLALPERVADALGSLDGIPAPIKRSFFRAIGNLITGAADVPAAWLEGKAAEIRTRTQGHQVVMAASAKAAAEKVAGDPALADRALEYHARQLVREQSNREKVAGFACEAIGEQASASDETVPPKDGQDREVDEEWLLQFSDIASRKSKEDVQIILGRILAGEVVKPGSFAPATLEVLARLDKETAQLFERLCRNALVGSNEWPFVIINQLGKTGEKELNSSALYHLQDIGLLNSVGQNSIIVEKFLNNKYLIAGVRVDLNKIEHSLGRSISLSPLVANFSQSGAQLRSVIKVEIDKSYAVNLRDGLARWGIGVSFPDLNPGLDDTDA